MWNWQNVLSSSILYEYSREVTSGCRCGIDRPNMSSSRCRCVMETPNLSSSTLYEYSREVTSRCRCGTDRTYCHRLLSMNIHGRWHLDADVELTDRMSSSRCRCVMETPNLSWSTLYEYSREVTSRCRCGIDRTYCHRLLSMNIHGRWHLRASVEWSDRICIIRKVKMSLGLIKHHAMKTYGEVEV
jgi:hypothetical protein